MLLAHVAFSDEKGDYSTLCFIPKGEGGDVPPPIKVDALVATEHAVFHIGPKEAVMVQVDPSHGTKLIKAVPPAMIMLTPDNPVKPGFNVTGVQLVRSPESDTPQVFYEKEHSGNWQIWEPWKTIR